MVWDRDAATSPAFDIALWGYDRHQVDRCLDELTGQLEEALGQLKLVESLRVQLTAARLEMDRLRQRQTDPAWNQRLATVMAAAEELRDQAARDADAIRGGAHHPGSRNGAVRATASHATAGSGGKRRR